MLVHFVLADGKIESEEMPCFGNTGRVDWKGCNPKLYTKIRDLSDQLEIARPANQSSSQHRWSGKVPVRYIQLQSDDTFRHLFHARYAGVMDYIVHRSIWAPLFDQSAVDIQAQNYINFRVDVLPSEIQTTLQIWMRDVFSRPNFPDTFEYFKQAFNEHLSFILAVCFPSMAVGSMSDHRMGCEGISAELSIDFWLAPDISKLKTIPYTMLEVHGYVMNITKVWKVDSKVIVNDLYHSFNIASRSYTVKGLFGNLQLTGVKDPIAVVKSVFEKKGIKL